jgi:hypothetical protein
MSKLLSISLSLFILFQSIGFSLNDMVKIDEFIEHAQFHSDQYGDNIFVFIAKHYGELKADHEKEHQEEKKDHEQLPFQHQTQLTVVADFILTTNKEDFKTLEFSEFKTHNFHYQAPSSSLHSEGILQPPRHS